MTNDAAGLQKNSAAPTTSSGSATRPSGMRASSVLAGLRVLQPVRAHLAAHHRRRDAVDGDAVRRQLDRVLLDQHHQRALGRAVGRVAAAAHAELRAHRQQVHLRGRPRRRRRSGGARRPGARNIAALRLTCTTSSKASSVTSARRSSRWMPTQLTSRSRRAEARGDRVDRGADRSATNARPSPTPIASWPAARSARGQRLGLGRARGPATATRAPASASAPGDRLADAAVAAGHEGDAAAQVELAGEARGRSRGGAAVSLIGRQSISRPPLRSTISPVMKPDERRGEEAHRRARTPRARRSGRPGSARSSAWRCASLSCSVTIGVRT